MLPNQERFIKDNRDILVYSLDDNEIIDNMSWIDFEDTFPQFNGVCHLVHDYGWDHNEGTRKLEVWVKLTLLERHLNKTLEDYL